MEQNLNQPTVEPSQPEKEKPGFTEGVFSIVCAVISLLFLPPFFGALGIFLGYQSKKKGQLTLGTIAMAISTTCMVLGMIIGVLVGAWLKTHK